MEMSEKQQHIVREGEDIFSISREVYGDVRKAFEIIEINPGVCRLYPGLVLDLPDGE